MLEQYRQQMILESPEFRQAQEAGENKESLPHTRDMAWILGVLSVGGNVVLHERIIRITRKKDHEFLEAFRKVAADTLNIQGTYHDNKRAEVLRYLEPDIVSKLGDLSRESWPTTLKEKHPWIFTDVEYKLGLIEGLFDARGGVYLGRNRSFTFAYGKNQEGSQLLIDLLTEIGVTNPRINKLGEAGIELVVVSDISSMCLLADNIKSRVSSKEQKLQSVRESLPPTKRVYRYRHDISPETPLINTNEILIEPSEDLAWILGVLAAGDSKRKRLTLSSSQLELLEEFKRKVERIFGLSASERVKYVNNKTDKTCKTVNIYNTSLKTLIGDMGTTEWPATINNSHHWILEEQQYTWKFLEGLFNVHGTVIDPTLFRAIRFNVNNIIEADCIAELLSNVGIKKINYRYVKVNSEERQVKSVNVLNIADLKIIVDNIHSLDPVKETRLDYIRNYEPRVNISSSDDEVIQEYVRIREGIGKPPPGKHIDRLKQQGKTKFSKDVYTRRFGGGSRSFIKACERIEEIAVASGLIDSPKKESQVTPEIADDFFNQLISD